jgi:hypothetical protein
MSNPKSSSTKLHEYPSKEYEVSAATVGKMWQHIGSGTGILLNQAEAILGDDIRIVAYKKMLKREIHRMAFYIQDTIYQAWKVQDETLGQIEEPIMDEPDEE